MVNIAIVLCGLRSTSRAFGSLRITSGHIQKPLRQIWKSVPNARNTESTDYGRTIPVFQAQ